MRILWLTNIKPGFISELDGSKKSEFGGWLDDMGVKLIDSVANSVYVVFPGKRERREVHNNVITYEFYEDKDNNTYFTSILREVCPDIIHIWGTEFAHSYYFYKACQKLDVAWRVVVSLQGILSFYRYHWCAGLPDKVVRRKSFLDVVLGRKSIQGQVKKLKFRSDCEKQLLSLCKNVIGRTRWDFACVKMLNPEINYYYCNESLRENFYNFSWTYSNCEKHSILTGSWGTPIKGLHNIVSAVGILNKRFPDLKVYVCGRSPFTTEHIRLNSYERYIGKLIRKMKLESFFVFTGLLSETEMCNAFLNCNVYVNSSSIENSANTICEAMLIGVPCVVSDVGGAHDMVSDGVDGFVYPYDEYYMMAHYIEQIFTSMNLAESVSASARINARTRHDRNKNYERMREIYDLVIESKHNVET